MGIIQGKAFSISQAVGRGRIGPEKLQIIRAQLTTSASKPNPTIRVK